MEEFSKLADSIYFHDENALYVNLFIPSELDWKERGVRIRQTTSFPAQPRTAFEIIAYTPNNFALKLRIPGWARGTVSISINGKPHEVSADAGSYLVAQRNWRLGDRVELTLPMDLHVEAMPDDFSVQAFLYGPLVLSSRLDETRLPDSLIAGFQAPDLKKEPPPEISPFTTGDADVRAWKRASTDSTEFDLYFGTGNSFSEPATTSDSIMALDMDTGKVLWWRQARQRYLAWRLHADDAQQSGAGRLSVALEPAALSEKQLRR